MCKLRPRPAVSILTVYLLILRSHFACCIQATAICSRPYSNPMSISCVTDPRQCTIVVTRQFILEQRGGRGGGREFARPTGNERSRNTSVECQQEISTEQRRHTRQKYHKRGHFQEVTLHGALRTGNFSRPNVYV